MMQRADFLSNSIIIGAHPDDEMLWFGSILDQVDQVLLVYEDFWPDPLIGPARSKALANFPRANVSSLRLPEAAVYGCADWDNPKLTDYGIELTRTADKRDAKQKALRLLGKSKAPAIGIRGSYEANFNTLVSKLRGVLKPNMNVFTHGPWGEYGHEEHIQVFRAVELLREEMGFTQWMSNYCTERALPLAKTYFDNQQHDLIQMPVNKDYCEQIAQVYRDAGCWTWSDDWIWFDTETFMQAPTKQIHLRQQGNLLPLNFFNINPA